MNISHLVKNYKTKHSHGFIQSEIDELLKQFPNINMKKFKFALNGITCMVDENGDVIIYHYDIINALRCGIENRDLHDFEWD